MSEDYPKDIEDDEIQSLEEDDFNETPPSDIIAFNELRSCADLLRMYKAKQLIIQPDFQRDIVWSQPAQTRFIDSLIKQLPIPSMCLSLDYKTGERLIIDGLQRMSSIIHFLDDEDWQLSKLDDIDERISGRTSGYLKENHPELFSQVENLTIPVTVLRCDYSKKNHMHYLFTIFHRLNTGGNKLNNQEIRNCIFQGNLNNLLKKIVLDKEFRTIFSLEPKKTYRFYYEEMLLRIFAFHENHEDYQGKLAKYLNDYMDANKDIDQATVEKNEQLMSRTVKLIYTKLRDGQPLPKLSKTVTEALFVGISRNIDDLERKTHEDLSRMFATLQEEPLFSTESLKGGLAAKDKVISRLTRAIEIFS